ncbi:MAG: Ig-like domain-containing protein [Gammaproteobacteria bacterium]|nr:Ig-like domain-containing protein [Gammaproteobacteria bacterium]
MRSLAIFFALLLFWSCEEDKGDKSAPEVSIVSPASGSIVNEIVTITCEATDNEEVEFVQFFVNDSLDSFLVASEPYIFVWNTNSMENGTYSIKAVAQDVNGNSAESSLISLTVDNSLSIPNSVEIENISYNLSQMTILFGQSKEDDFKSYTLYVSGSSDSSDIVEIGQITEQTDTVFTPSEFDPTQQSWYFVMVTDIYGYSVLSTGYSVLDGHPTVPILKVPRYNNGILMFSWSISPDTDFLRYHLYSSTSSDMFGKTIIVTNAVKNDTTHSLVLNLTDPLKYYQIIVEDQWGFFSESSIVQANMPFTMIKNYGGTQNERGYSVKQTSDGGYVIVGSSTSYGAGGSDLWILKVDGLGEFSWSKTYGGQGNDIGRDITQTSDGGYIITGYTKSFSSGGDMDLWLIKTDANGESCLYSDGGTCSENSSKWIKSFGTSGNDYGNSVQETSEGDFIVAGKSGRIPSVFVIKTNSSGEKIWENLYGTGPGDRAQYIIERQDLGFLIVGKENANNVDDNLCLINIDTDGAEVWHSLYGGGGADGGNHISEVSGGGYIIAGATKSYGNGNWDDLWLVKTSTGGSMEWQKTFGGSYTETGNYTHEKDEGGYMVTGSTESIGQGFYDIWVVSTDYTGNEIYSQTFGGNMDDKAIRGARGNSGELLIIGYTNSFGNGGEDVLLIKIDPNYQP